jgi:hypothetical protein
VVAAMQRRGSQIGHRVTSSCRPYGNHGSGTRHRPDGILGRVRPRCSIASSPKITKGIAVIENRVRRGRCRPSIGDRCRGRDLRDQQRLYWLHGRR